MKTKCYECQKDLWFETDNIEICIECDTIYCVDCAEKAAAEWYNDGRTITWIRWCEHCPKV